MAVYKTMYPPQKDSPTTFTTAALLSGSTTMTVANAYVLPQTFPYPLTIGVDKAQTEVVLVTAADLGTNTLTISRFTGSMAWDIGAAVARAFNADDLSVIQENINNMSALEIKRDTLNIERLPTGTGSTQVALGNHTHKHLCSDIAYSQRK